MLKVLVVPVVLVVLTLSACVQAPVRVGLPGAVAISRPRIPSTVRVQFHDGGALVVRDVPLEQYVETTILSELHPDAADAPVAERLFEVQAILARTYAVSNAGRHLRDGFDLCSTTHCQLYDPARLKTSRWASAAREAVRRTSGQLIWYGDQPARAVFHADCGGHTSDATAVWGGTPVPYLVGAPDACVNAAAYGRAVEYTRATERGTTGYSDRTDRTESAERSQWTFETRAAALRAALDKDARTNVGVSLERVEVAGRDAAGRAELITLRGTRTFVVRGEVFRDVVTRALGVKSIRSTLFSVKRLGERFVFTGRGYGHGVGLCQAGAAARIRSGASPRDVLSHYFPGTALR